MTIFNFLDKYAGQPVQEEQAAKQAYSRRSVFRQFGQVAKDAAVVGLPLGAALFSPKRAIAAPPSNMIIDVLNFALTLEYLEADFYAMGLSSNNLLSGDTQDIIAQIGKHENAHVDFLSSTIESLGGTPADRPEFDFTAGGTFSDVFSNRDTFLALAQAFEDTGVRAYKGQAANLMGEDAILKAALQIHSVEARHASEVRALRGSSRWITQAENTTAAAAASVYAGEDNTTFLGVDARPIVSVGNDALTQAYDEPLSKEEVLAIAGLFIV